MKKHIPNLITCMNVTSGTVAIYAAFHGHLYLAAWLVILAMVFDFFDGFAARLLRGDAFRDGFFLDSRSGV